MVGYEVADANSYLVVTGQGIEDVRIVKKALIWPFQKCTNMSIAPFDFSITLQAMTIEKLQFSLPAVFTIGPENEMEALRKYAMLLTGSDDTARTSASHSGRSHVQDIVKGIIEGETRVIVSSLTMEEIFRERQVFKTKVIHSVQEELNQFGLKIYNANVKELQDTPGSEYFQFLSRKAHEGASNQAKIDVANARMIGEIGEAEKRGKTRQEVSKIDAQTAVLETQRKSEKSKADAELTTTQTRLNMNIKLAQIEADRQAEAKDAELKRDVERKRADMELERRRASDVVKSKIERESAEQKAEAAAFTRVKEADATLLKQKREADGAFYTRQKAADGEFYALQKEADARFYAQKREAEGLAEMAKAYGSLADALGGPQGLMQYLMVKGGTYERLAESNARAVQGLSPKISVWSTGAEASGSGAGAGVADPAAAIRNIFQTLPPLLDTVQTQTGMTPPSWLVNMPQQNGQGHEVAKTNGTKA